MSGKSKNPNLKEFEDREKRFEHLRQEYKARRLDKRAYTRALKKLLIRATDGRYWTMGADSGLWYVYDRGAWKEADPRKQLTTAGAGSPRGRLPHALSVLALIVANLFPVVGLLLFGWQVSTIVFVYWLENIVIGAWNVVRMKKARGKAPRMKYTVNDKPADTMKRKGLINFFILHYGFFTLGHGVFVLILFGLPGEGLLWVLITLLLLVVSHGVSYFKNFIQGGEYLTVAYSDLFVQPYSRIIILHLVVILSGFWILKGKVGHGAVYMMVGLKLFVDIIAHLLERRKLIGRPR